MRTTGSFWHLRQQIACNPSQSDGVTIDRIPKTITGVLFRTNVKSYFGLVARQQTHWRLRSINLSKRETMSNCQRSSKCQRNSELLSWLSQIGLAIVMLVTVAFVSGCHRGYYRRQADAEANRLIREKSVDPRWNGTKDAGIDIDPMSRMFDPFSSDHPPLPPDDPSSHQLMHRVNGHRGYPHWHANGCQSMKKAKSFWIWQLLTNWHKYTLPTCSNNERRCTCRRWT